MKKPNKIQSRKLFNKTQARDNFFKIYEMVMEDHELIEVTGNQGKMFILSEKEYDTLLEMIHIYSTPGLVEKIKKGMETPINQCTDIPEWE